MRSAAAISFVSVLWLIAIPCKAWQENTFRLEGVVRDSGGREIPGVSVRLQSQGHDRSEERTTDSAGSFVFASLSAGMYVVSAGKGTERSGEVSVRGKGGAVELVELKLTNNPNHTSDQSSNNGKAAEMGFSDLPNFTVAAVTDWTAAGGHGSDTSLRTSESLTRETMQLKPAPNSGLSSARAANGTEQHLRKVLDASPRDLRANEELGRFYLKEERYSDAVAPLETAYDQDPTQKDNEYELAIALNRSGETQQAQVHVDRLLAAGNKPEWHRLAGEIDEKLGNPLGAVHAFERAAKEDASEENYFAWGTELLKHRAIWQAKDVFESGVKAYPNSPRLLTALGTALFSAALYGEAAQRLCEASDLIPNDAEPYLFMGRVDIAAPDPLPCIETKLRRFLDLQPTNALANYYYAMAYWKLRGKNADAEVLEHVQKLLSRAVESDSKCSSAYLELGVIRASLSDFQGAAEFYQKAIEADPLSTEAHYRLGVVYDRLGEKVKAAQELQLHDELEKTQAAAVDRQRREVKQFLVEVGGNGENKTTQP